MSYTELVETTRMTPKPLITYIRVSTSRQGRSGLGIEAQRQVLAQFTQAEGFEVTREFVEVETGKGSDAMGAVPSSKLHWPPHGSSSATWLSLN